MMFATCDRARALGFIKKLFPSYLVEDNEQMKWVLDLVEADKIRVLDPEFHSGAIIQANATDVEWQAMQSDLLKTFSGLTKNKPLVEYIPSK